MPTAKIFQTFIDKSKTKTNTRWLLSELGASFLKSGWLAAGNGTYNYGKIPGGTAVGIKTSDGELHPIGHATVTDTVSSSNTITIGTAATKHFLVGDQVDLIDDEGAGISNGSNRIIASKDETAGTITLVAGTAVSMAIGDQVVKDNGTQTFYGFLELVDKNPRMGFYDTDDSPIVSAKGVKVIMNNAVIKESELPYINSFIKAQVTALGAGFRFL